MALLELISIIILLEKAIPLFIIILKLGKN